MKHAAARTKFGAADGAYTQWESLEGRDFHVEKENGEGADGCFSLIHAVRAVARRAKWRWNPPMIRLLQTTVLRAVYIMTAATMSMPRKYRKKRLVPGGNRRKGETTGRKLIRNVDMDVETESFDALLASAQSQAEELGGYIESSSISNSSYASSTSAARSARLTARIPSEKLDGYLAGISKQSNVTRKSESTEDVTLCSMWICRATKGTFGRTGKPLSMMEQAESIEGYHCDQRAADRCTLSDRKHGIPASHL